MDYGNSRPMVSRFLSVAVTMSNCANCGGTTVGTERYPYIYYIYILTVAVASPAGNLIGIAVDHRNADL
jgi:hypothetical protein